MQTEQQIEELKKDLFFDRMEALGLALSFGDVRLKTDYTEILPPEACLESFFSRNVQVKCPIISSPMDTVTEHRMAIAMAKLGGLGIIHKGLDPKAQAAEVARVKFECNGFIERPIYVKEDDKMGNVIRMAKEKFEDRFHSFPVINSEGKLVGVLTHSNFEFYPNLKSTVRENMSRELITAQQGVSLKTIFKKMCKHRVKLIPVLNNDGSMAGMYVFKDVERNVKGVSPTYNLDNNGNLRVGAAIGVGDDAFERTELLVAKGVDVVVIDSAHADSKTIIATLKQLKNNFCGVDVVVGNISQPDSAKRLVDAGADGIKIGQGPGSICTTRIIAGIGTPQVTAVYNCAKAIRGSGIPICADGGIKYSGDGAIALAVGAHTVMLGNMLAGTLETPGEVIQRDGVPVKIYRGMGSLKAMQDNKASRERYGQAKSELNKLVPEGVEGVVPFKGEVADIIFQFQGGLQSSMGYQGAATIPLLQAKADFYRLTGAGMGESHPHGITITKEAPNYRL